jgi:uncharacterized membrane protein YbhN (UPF0104 family)
MTEQPLQTRFDSDNQNPIDTNLMSDETPKSSSAAMTWFKKIAPWAVAGAIMYALFSEVPIADAWEALRSARLELFLPVMMISVLVWFLIDSAAFAFIFTRFNANLEWSEARSLRGMTYLVTPINWNLGTAAVILHLRTSKKIGALDSTSTMAFYQMIDGLLLASFVALGAMLLPSSPEIESLQRIASVFVVVQVVSMWLFVATRPNWGWLSRIRSFGIFRTHQASELRDIAVLVLMKGVYFSVFIGVFWLGCHSFGIDLPLQLAIASTPAILLVGSLPITPAGLGTQQAAMIYFFAPYGDEASILAFGLTFPVALLLFRSLIGVCYLKDLPKLRQAIAGQNA